MFDDLYNFAFDICKQDVLRLQLDIRRSGYHMSLHRECFYSPRGNPFMGFDVATDIKP